MAADALHVAVHLVVPSGVLIRWHSTCRHACSASAHPAAWALLSHVQVSCLEPAGPVALAAFAGALAAHAAAPPGRRGWERMREANAEGKTKGGGTCRPAKPVCTWGGEARSGFAAVPLGA